MLTWISGGCCNKGGEESMIKLCLWLFAYPSLVHWTALQPRLICPCPSGIDSNSSVSTFNNLFISGPAVRARIDSVNTAQV